jgi:coniferyl-aldehyde dehydrogenase
VAADQPGRSAATDYGESADMRALLDAQRSDFLRSGPPSAALRKDRIDRLILLLTENVDEFSEALCTDFGNRPHVVNLISEVGGILPDLTLTRRRLERWMRPERPTRLAGMVGLPTIVEKKPLGVVGVIGPWNFPVSLVAQPAASALAAGNRVMIKFSEATPRTAAVFAAKVAGYFDPTELAVVTGGPDVGAAFSALPFDHIFFTGSPRVGALVASTAAKNLVPVTLELGGKNPAVVAHDADVAVMAHRIMAARLANGGQVCLCPDYVFVPSDRLSPFVESALDGAREAATAHGGSGLVSLVDDKNFQRVAALIDDARRRGATVHDVGTPFDRSRRRIPPTVLVGVTDDMDIAHEEVFGPVLSVLPYDTIEEVCDYVRTRPAPLAAYWYGKTGPSFDHFRERTTSGGITVNDFALHCAIIAGPFGGVGRSGWGAYHGKAGFDTFTHHRTVTKSRLPMSLARLITPPYPAVVRPAVSGYIRFERYRANRRRKRRG